MEKRSPLDEWERELQFLTEDQRLWGLIPDACAPHARTGA